MRVNRGAFLRSRGCSHWLLSLAREILNQVGSVDMMRLCDIEAILISRPKRRYLIREPRFRGTQLLPGFNDERPPFECWQRGPYPDFHRDKLGREIDFRADHSVTRCRQRSVSLPCIHIVSTEPFPFDRAQGGQVQNDSDAARGGVEAVDRPAALRSSLF